MRSVQDAAVEVGAGDQEVIFVYGTPAVPPSVVLRPLDPTVDVAGTLLVRESDPPGCVAALGDAFT